MATNTDNHYILSSVVDYLKTKGVNDFTKYQCVIGYEPPKLMEVFNKIL